MVSNAFTYHCVSPLAPLAGDAFYAFFPLAHLILVYLHVFVTDGPEDKAAKAFVFLVHGDNLKRSDLKAYILSSEATSALFGGASLSDIAIKFVSRGLPLITAPLRVRLAFVIRQASSSSRDSKLKLTTSTRTTFPVEEDIDAVADVSSVPPEPPHQA